ncbi:MAG: hypothetical protein AAGA95_22195 [Pseudomonadota bacterium]
MKSAVWLAPCLTTLLTVSSAHANDWHFAVGGTYLSGFTDLTDTLEENLEDRGFVVDSLVIPIGVSFQGYQEFDSGLGWGFSVGPAMGAFGDIDFFNLPVGLDARYSFGTEGSRPYVRLGARYHLATGDDIDSGGVGPYAAVGYEFRKPNAAAGWGIEVAYDGAEIELESLRSETGMVELRAADVMVSVFAIF